MYGCVFSFEVHEYQEHDCYLSLAVPLIPTPGFSILLIDIVAISSCLAFFKPLWQKLNLSWCKWQGFGKLSFGSANYQQFPLIPLVRIAIGPENKEQQAKLFSWHHPVKATAFTVDNWINIWPNSWLKITLSGERNQHKNVVIGNSLMHNKHWLPFQTACSLCSRKIATVQLTNVGRREGSFPWCLQITKLMIRRKV